LQRSWLPSIILPVSSTAAGARGFELDLGSSLWGRSADVCVFAGSAGVALFLAELGERAGLGASPGALFLLFVLGVDVAHVHATWFRTYFDGVELRRHWVRYALVPLACYVLLWLAYRQGPLVFWRGLAYVAVFHFIRQQVGWVAVYRARDGTRRRLERWIDDAAIYAATAYPLLYWHASLEEKEFSWFVAGDFLQLPLRPYLPWLFAVWLAALGAFVVRELYRVLVFQRLAFGRTLIVTSTALTWYVAIVVHRSDLGFTIVNVVPHGVPYAWLLFVYLRERARRREAYAVRGLASLGFLGFCAVLVSFAFVEQLAWDRLVDHERPWLFGSGPELGELALGIVVPLLALPQATHYVLDGLIWRRRETRARPAQRAALGFGDFAERRGRIASEGGGDV
jgi:hypothetical protein